MQVPSVIPLVLVSLCVIGLELALAMRAHPAARTWGAVALAGIVAFPAAVVLHNVLAAIIGREEAVSFVVALFVAPAATAAGTVGVALALARDGSTRLLGFAFGAAGTGLGLFAAYSLFALVVTGVAGENPPYQAPIEVMVLPVAALAMAGGALLGAFSLIGRARPRPAG